MIYVCTKIILIAMNKHDNFKIPAMDLKINNFKYHPWVICMFK